MSQDVTQQIASKIISLLGPSISFVGGFLSAILAEPIRKKIFKPRLELEFKNNQDFKTLTPEHTHMGPSEAFFVRVRVKNKSWYTAFGCRAHLVSIERRNKGGDFEHTDFVDSLRLAWSCQPSSDDAYRPIDIPKGVNQFVDVFSVRPRFRGRSSNTTFKEELRPGNFVSTFQLETQIKPLRYMNLENEAGEYRYTILVTADGVNPKFIRLIFKWDNDWAKFEVKKD